MTATDDSDSFYQGIPVFHGFHSLMEPALYKSLPKDWTIAVADIVQSTKAIRENRYKAVNMAGAATIAAVKNALDQVEFPYVFGGDGSSFAVPPHQLARASEAVAATAAWAKDELDLVMRVALVPVEIVRAQGLDVRVARFAASPNVSYAMFSGGGLGWAEAAMKRGEYALSPAPPGSRPDLTGLSCRFAEIPAVRGLILSVVVVAAAGASHEAFRSVIEEVVALVETSPDASSPVPPAGPPLRWSPTSAELEARTRSAAIPLFVRQGAVLARTFIYHLILRHGIRVGAFVPATYLQQVVVNSDFRKFDDGLRMTLDCTPELADTIDRRLVAAASAGAVRYGLHRQDTALMTCFTPSPTHSDHVHFIDGARGGYSSAATALKAMLG